MPVVKKYPLSFISTYPPNRCGIGTFTHDVVKSIAALRGENLSTTDQLKVTALSERVGKYDYGDEVAFEIETGNQMDYIRAADYINISSSKAVSIQHEFGIFGGDDGAYLLTALNRLRKPVVTTLHTVLEHPSDHQKEVLTEVCRHSTEVVILAHKARELLQEIYQIPEDKITMIPHGAPDVPFLDATYYKEDFGFEDRRVILTFGLLSPNKGIEMGIEAMERVVEQFPDSLYIVLGQTHPNIKQQRGEEYRVSLKQKVQEKGLSKNVVFYDRFVPKPELIKYLVSADIYLTPYMAKEQISSGTLAYAVAMGKAIVSTPYWYAEELLAEDRGRLVPFGDSKSLADTLIELLGDEGARQRMRRRAYEFGRKMIWPEVAKSYLHLFEEVEQRYERQMVKTRTEEISPTKSKIPELPEVKLSHLRVLTDETGIFQHATFGIPNRSHGYTTDDNSRAVIATLKHWNLFEDKSVLSLFEKYLAFLQYALESGDGRVRNLMNFDRTWVPNKKGSEDSHGRTVWALGQVVADASLNWLVEFAADLFHRAISGVGSFNSPRAWAFSLLGILSYLEKFSGDRNARITGEELGEKLATQFRNNSSSDWPWGEDVVSYENARLPQALISLGSYLENDEYLQLGIEALDWLIDIQTADEGHFSLIGTEGWLTRDGTRAKFDQQPVEIPAIIDAAYEAYKATGKEQYLNDINKAFRWFLGTNDLAKPLYNFETGGCKDGLHSTRINQNEGAESQLSWLLSLYKLHEILGELEGRS